MTQLRLYCFQTDTRVAVVLGRDAEDAMNILRARNPIAHAIFEAAQKENKMSTFGGPAERGAIYLVDKI